MELASVRLLEQNYMSTFAIVLLLAVIVIAAAVALFRAWSAGITNLPMGRFVDVDGVRLHYVERGSGPTLLLLHGNGSMIQDFDTSGLIETLAARYHTIVFDRPGYGHSTRPRGRTWTPRAQAELIHKALQQLGIERPMVVGHSWGTLVALELALLYPAEIKSLVLLSGYYFPTLRPDVPMLAAPAIPVIGDVYRYTLGPLVARLLWPIMLRIIFGPANPPPRFNDGFPKWMAFRPKQLRASAAESGLLIPSAAALRDRYEEIRIPVFIVAGTKDRFVRAKRHSARLHSKIAQSDLRLLPEVGHMIHHVATRAVVAVIDAAAKVAHVTPPKGAKPSPPERRPKKGKHAADRHGHQPHPGR